MSRQIQFHLATPLLAVALNSPASAQGTNALEELGKRVFFTSISSPRPMSCASCHSPLDGLTSGNAHINLGQVAMNGAHPHRKGNRKPFSIAYSSFSPQFGDSKLFSEDFGPCTPDSRGLSCGGGVFWDGRADGTAVGYEIFAEDPSLEAAYERFLGPLTDQALGPFANDVEQNVPDGHDNGVPGAEAVCRAVASHAYAELYEIAWGEEIDCEITGVDISFKRIALAISAWEHSSEVNSFSSWRDVALAHDDDSTPGAFPLRYFSDQENLGHDLFYGVSSALNPTGKNARCSTCHNSEELGSLGDEPLQVYTDQTFHHIGLPPNYELANFNLENPDLGLANITGGENHRGHFRTPTLRNVDARRRPGFPKAYMHNGYFKNLEDIVHFYNTATVKENPELCPPGTTAAQARQRDCWPAAETPAHPGSARGTILVGDLGLTSNEEAAVVAYMRTLSDYEVLRRPRPYRCRNHGSDHDHARYHD